MKFNRTAAARGFSAMILCFAVGIAACQSHQERRPGPSAQAAGNDLKIVDNPGGGQFGYGSLTGQGTKEDALVYMLHQVHGHFGDKPLVGKFFQSRDHSSLATFFTVNARNMGGKMVAGLVIVSIPKSGAPQAAVLYDYANRFVSTEPSMMKALSAAWQGAGGSAGGTEAPEGQGAGARGTAEHLTWATAGDRSATIGLPQGWRITAVAGGQLTAEGPRGEMVGLGLLYQQIIDPRNPQAQSMARMPGFNRTPHIICPLTGDLFSAYVSVTNQVRHNLGLSQGTFNLTSSTNLPPDGGPVRPLQAIFTVDLHDGKGPRKGSARIGVLQIRGIPTWAMTVSSSNVPAQFADAEAATMTAVINSYSQDAKVIAQEGAADLETIRQVGIRSRMVAEEADQRREASSQAYEAHRQALNQNSSEFNEHMGNIDWSSKLTQDYILDRSVVRDNDWDAAATASNKFADSLVRANPNRFEIVQNQELIRGRDY